MKKTKERIRNKKRIVNAKKREVRCNCCNRIIKQKERFKVVMVYDADRVDEFFHQAWSNQEKHLIICNDCILNMNFREWVKSDNV